MNSSIIDESLSGGTLPLSSAVRWPRMRGRAVLGSWSMDQHWSHTQDSCPATRALPGLRQYVQFTRAPS